MNIFKKLVPVILILSLIFSIYQFVYATDDNGSTSGFLVKTSQKTFNSNTPIDLTILAIDSEGYLVKNYSGEIFIDLEGNLDLDYEEDYTMSNDGLYEFSQNDKGYKIFEEFLIVKKPGKYSIIVSDMLDENIMGKYNIIVLDSNNGNDDIEDVEDVIQYDMDEVIHWMYDNGLSDYSTPETFKPQKNIRRDEASKFVTIFAQSILDQQGQENSVCYMFNDIAKNNKLRNYIIQSCELGYMKGGNKKFNPRGNLTNEQAIAIVIRMYDGRLEEPKSNRSKNYYSRAKELNLLDGLNLSDKKKHITRGDFAILLHRLGTELMYGETREDSEAIYEQSEDEVTEIGDSLIQGLEEMMEYFIEMLGFKVNSHTGLNNDFISKASICQSGNSITTQTDFDMLGMKFIINQYTNINGRNGGKCEIYQRIEDADVNISSGQIEKALSSGFTLDEINEQILEMRSAIKETIGNYGMCLYDTGTLVNDLKNQLSGTFLPSSLVGNSMPNCTGSLYQDD